MTQSFDINELGPEWVAFIEEQVRNGRYANEAEVVFEALRMLEAKLGREE